MLALLDTAANNGQVSLRVSRRGFGRAVAVRGNTLVVAAGGKGGDTHRGRDEDDEGEDVIWRQ